MVFHIGLSKVHSSWFKRTKNYGNSGQMVYKESSGGGNDLWVIKKGGYMQNGIKHSLLLAIVGCLAAILLISGCPRSSSTDGCIGGSCGPHSIAFSSSGTVYLLGYLQLLAIDPTGNIILNGRTGNPFGWFSDMFSISKSGNIWEVTPDLDGYSSILMISNSQGNFVTQITTDISILTSVIVSPSTDIGWVGGQNYTSTGIITPELEALNISGQTLTSFTLPANPTSNGDWILSTVKLAISPINGTIWAWSPGYLSGYSFTELVYGPYPVNLLEVSYPYFIGCGTNEKWMAVNPVTNDIWMGSPATTTVLALSPNGAVQFQKNLDIYVSTMTVSPKTGNVWIGSNNKIEVLDPYGNIIKQLTIKNLNCITYIAVSPLDGTVWVGNSVKIGSTDKNIFILDENGNIINSFYVPDWCFVPCPG
ncbi:MAG: hypothetical protein M1491_09120 [Deltaproteobacteria bacterium]|nr:hypothetical protein [Deltaproteobacteria bacterium]MCL5276807.1 hypothetical protein [Deltaproteobacteria bacterium]